VKLDPDVLYVDDGNLTSAGTAAGSTAACTSCGNASAPTRRTASRRLVIPPHRQGGQAQYVPQPVARIRARRGSRNCSTGCARASRRRAQRRSLAARVLMSRRTFTRRFRQATGTTVTAWLHAERLTHAQHLLETTGQSIDAIAQAAGYGSSVSLRQHFAGALGTSPSAYRRDFAARRPAGGGRADRRKRRGCGRGFAGVRFVDRQPPCVHGEARHTEPQQQCRAAAADARRIVQREDRRGIDDDDVVAPRRGVEHRLEAAVVERRGRAYDGGEQSRSSRGLSAGLPARSPRPCDATAQAPLIQRAAYNSTATNRMIAAHAHKGSGPDARGCTALAARPLSAPPRCGSGRFAAAISDAGRRNTCWRRGALDAARFGTRPCLACTTAPNSRKKSSVHWCSARSICRPGSSASGPLAVAHTT
jgi:AraC-like DNA-binding protein